MWRGRFEFGDGWAAYQGGTDANSPHRHVAIQIAVVRTGKVRIRCGEREVSGRAVIVPPMLEHQILPSACEITAFYLEPEALMGRALRDVCGGVAVAAPAIVTESLTHDEPAVAMADLLKKFGVKTDAALDPRLSSALAFLRVSLGAPGAVQAAALEVGLSAPRLRELARAGLGVPLSQWLLWQKLGRASRAASSGASLADAAAAGGFADQAHFARTMRRMFGVTPRIAVEALG